MIESSLGIVGACLPLLKPVFIGMSPQSIFSSLRNWTLFGRSRETIPKEDHFANLEAGNIAPEKRSFKTTAVTPWDSVE